ncbi:MAG: nitroreductase family protein [Candidatus Stahlbacteria bacterium]|nr:nitroreductase family protein [Candidatus Stahlbacteria bacterium]
MEEVRPQIRDAILHRRSVRRYKPDELPDNLLEQVLEAARWAPSWANTQCWEFIIVKDKGLKEKLRDTLTPNNPARDAVVQAPIVIVACGKSGIAGYKKGEPVTDKQEWFMFDVALALNNITLVAHSLGLGTVHIGAFDAKKVAKIVNVADGVLVVELMPIGYPDEQPAPRPRKEISSFVYLDKHGCPYEDRGQKTEDRGQRIEDRRDRSRA